MRRSSTLATPRETGSRRHFLTTRPEPCHKAAFRDYYEGIHRHGPISEAWGWLVRQETVRVSMSQSLVHLLRSPNSESTPRMESAPLPKLRGRQYSMLIVGVYCRLLPFHPAPSRLRPRRAALIRSNCDRCSIDILSDVLSTLRSGNRSGIPHKRFPITMGERSKSIRQDEK